MLNSLAVLIDADNASAKTIDDVLQAIEKFGKISTKKIYGDWSASGLSASWQEAILRHAIDPMQQFAYVKGKNATDIALVIEAMDLLHSGEYDGFCLVSSDSDFASLAVRIRKSGVKVFGFGRKEAVVSFRQACDDFFEVENLKGTKENAKTTKLTTNQLKQDTKLMNALNAVIQNLANINDDNWSDYKEVLIQFSKKHSDLNHENYGYEKLIHLIKATDMFYVKNDKENPAKLYVKSKTPFKYSTKQLQADKTLVDAIKTLLDNNPKAEQDGWCNISYIASELNKNPQINMDNYGYKKFSDLITAIRLFDIKKQSDGVYIKAKNKPVSQNTEIVKDNASEHKPLTLAQITQNPLVVNGVIDIKIQGVDVDAVLWRLGENKKVRHDGDMIFYGQTQSDDNTIVLNDDNQYELFRCQLSTQNSDICQMVLSASRDGQALNSITKVTIEQNGKRLFADDFIPTNDVARSAILLVFLKVQGGWRVVPRPQFVKHDLRGLCTVFGVVVDD